MSRRGRPSAPPVGAHAVVVGASMAGLAASATLASRFTRVTLIERDAPAALGEGRRGVPQGAHAHLLLPAGLRALEALLPGITDDITAEGGHVIPAPEFRFYLGSGRLALSDGTMAITGTTRPLLEGVVRQRVTGLGNVSLLDGRVLDRPATDASRSAVVGVHVHEPKHEHAEVIDADLVVDATGRRSHTAAWLEELGFPTPVEERIEVGVHYSTRLFSRDPADLDGCRHVAIAAPPGIRRGGLALAVEGDRWLVTLVGTVGERPPTEIEEFVEFAESLWQPDLHELVSSASPIGDAVTGGFPAHRRRCYDRLRRFPERFVVTGDALCSLSPLYAQGMAVAACEATRLGEVLDRHGLDTIGPRFFRRTRTLVDTAWTLATSADLADPEIDGRRTIGWRLLSRYLDRALAAATADPVVADALLAVNALVAPPPTILRPGIAMRVLGRRRGGSGHAAPPPTFSPPGAVSSGGSSGA